MINRSVPLIAIQLNAWEVGGVMTLTATKVMDLLPVARDDEEDAPGQGVDRAFWVARSKPESLQLADDLLALIHQATGDASLALKYNKANMGLALTGSLTTSSRSTPARPPDTSWWSAVCRRARN